MDKSTSGRGLVREQTHWALHTRSVYELHGGWPGQERSQKHNGGKCPMPGCVQCNKDRALQW